MVYRTSVCTHNGVAFQIFNFYNDEIFLGNTPEMIFGIQETPKRVNTNDHNSPTIMHQVCPQ